MSGGQATPCHVHPVENVHVSGQLIDSHNTFLGTEAWLHEW